MRLCILGTAVACALLAIDGRALAGTKVQLSLVPVVGRCLHGVCSNGHPDVEICAIGGGDCDVGGVSSQSKLTIDGNLVAKLTVKGVTDIGGERVTTDAVEGSADDYIVKLTLRPCSTSCDPSDLYLKLDLKKGARSMKVDLRSMFILAPPAGTPFGVEQARLYVAPANPAACPGTNSGAAILARLNDADCETGGFVGVAGIMLQ